MNGLSVDNLKRKKLTSGGIEPPPINHEMVELVIVPTSRIPLKYNLFPSACVGFFFRTKHFKYILKKKNIWQQL